MSRRWTWPLIGLISVMTGCVSLPAPVLSDCAAAPARPITVSPDGARASTTFDVLTFNIEGLGWPARGGRGASLARIGTILGGLAATGRGPDVIMVQEMFSQAAVDAMTGLGYPNMVSGPSRTQSKTLSGAEKMPRPFTWKKGEIGIHFASAGLAILSRFPIVESHSEPFGRRRCAGLDCLSNKGILYGRLAIPGMPGTVNVFNTHLNSQRSSRVSPARHARAHRLQVEELEKYITAVGNPDIPTILGGDFNMRGSAIRFQRFRNVTEPFQIVHEYCTDQPLACDTRISWDGDAPWLDTQDLQLFESGTDVQIVPIRVAAMFDGSAGNPRLSDHDGFLVTYRASWPTRLGDIACRSATAP